MKKMTLTLILLMSTTVFASENLCPEDNTQLNKPGFEKHFMNFVNFAYRFKGRCRGHSIVTQKSFYLMEFNKGENPLNCGPENFPFECQKVYYDKFAEVFFDGKVTEIPGFKNMDEFSKVPYIEGLLKYHVRSTPISFKTLEARNRFLDKEENPSLAYFKEAVERIQEYQKPYIAIESYWTGNHAVIGYKFVKDDKGFRLCVRDPNLIPNLQIDCENYFYIGKLETEVPPTVQGEEPTIKVTDEVYYHKRGEEVDRHLFKVRVYTEEDKRVDTFIKARAEYCLQNKAK
jgi:hypothetical protein